MKITNVTRHREHKINVGNYESVVLGAFISAQPDVEDDPLDVADSLDSLLDDALDKPIERVLALAKEHPEINESHTWGFYQYE